MRDVAELIARSQVDKAESGGQYVIGSGFLRLLKLPESVSERRKGGNGNHVKR
jgi:hypothetical protein